MLAAAVLAPRYPCLNIMPPIPNELLQHQTVLDQVANILVQSGKKQTARTIAKNTSLRAKLLPDSQVLLDLIYESCGSEVELPEKLDTKCSRLMQQWLVWDALESRNCTIAEDPYGAVLAAHNWIRSPGMATKALAYKAYGRAWATYSVHPAANAAYIAGITRLSNDMYNACRVAGLGSYQSTHSHPTLFHFSDRDSVGYVRATNRMKLYQLLCTGNNMPVPNVDLVLPEPEKLPRRHRKTNNKWVNER